MTTQTSASDQQAGYAGFEYAKVQAPKQLEALYRDAYRNFGWSLESAQTRPPIRPLPLLPAIRSNTVTLNFTRDRSIKNRPMVQELQKKADASLASIAQMERAKKSGAATVATVLGVVGAVLLAVSVFMGALGVLPIVLGAIGLLVWAGAVIAYFGVKSSRTAKLDPRIDAEHDAVFEAGEQAARLIH